MKSMNAISFYLLIIYMILNAKAGPITEYQSQWSADPEPETFRQERSAESEAEPESYKSARSAEPEAEPETFRFERSAEPEAEPETFRFVRSAEAEPLRRLGPSWHNGQRCGRTCF